MGEYSIMLPIELTEIIFETTDINPIISKWWFEKLKATCAKKYLMRYIEMSLKTKDDIYATMKKLLGRTSYTMQYWCCIREPIFSYSEDMRFEYGGKYIDTDMYLTRDLRCSTYDKGGRYSVVRRALSVGTIKSLIDNKTKAIPFDTKAIRYSIILEEINKQINGNLIWQIAYITVSAKSLGIKTEIYPSYAEGGRRIGLLEEAERLLNCIKQNLINDTIPNNNNTHSLAATTISQ
jgi:hypothetical protein